MLLVDILFVVILVGYALLGYRRGFLAHLVELIGFVLSFGIAFLLYRPLGSLFVGFSHGNAGIVNLLAFLILWTGFEFGIGWAWRRYGPKVPAEVTNSPANRLAGLAPALLKGVALLTILLLIVATSPLPAAAKHPIVDSSFGKRFLNLGTGLEQQFNNLFGQAFRDTLAFRTVKTEGDESVALGFTVADPKVCQADEQKMLDLVNHERTSRGLKSLHEDDALRDVGRAHSKDMLVRGYFSHVNPDGLDPFERMDRVGITGYTFAGENLAFAPTVDIAHTGLMNSPGHRANILKPEFTKLGIGCADAGIRGKMFSQEFDG